MVDDWLQSAVKRDLDLRYFVVVMRLLCVVKVCLHVGVGKHHVLPR